MPSSSAVRASSAGAAVCQGGGCCGIHVAPLWAGSAGAGGGRSSKGSGCAGRTFTAPRRARIEACRAGSAGVCSTHPARLDALGSLGAVGGAKEGAREGCKGANLAQRAGGGGVGAQEARGSARGAQGAGGRPRGFSVRPRAAGKAGARGGGARAGVVLPWQALHAGSWGGGAKGGAKAARWAQGGRATSPAEGASRARLTRCSAAPAVLTSWAGSALRRARAAKGALCAGGAGRAITKAARPAAHRGTAGRGASLTHCASCAGQAGGAGCLVLLGVEPARCAGLPGAAVEGAKVAGLAEQALGLPRAGGVRARCARRASAGGGCSNSAAVGP